MEVCVVTAFFNLSASREDKVGIEHYLDPELAKIRYPLVVIGDKDYIKAVKDLRGDRPLYCMEKDINELETMKYKEMVDSNRQRYWPTCDQRCNTQVHLLMFSKYYFMKEVMNVDPFKSDIFVWMDCNCLKKNQVTADELKLDNMIGKDVIHAHMISAVPKMDDYSFYSRYRYSISGMMFAMNRNMGTKFLELIMEEMDRITKAGYGHGDEMLWPSLLDHPDLNFEFSYGDYQHTVKNWNGIIDPTSYDYIMNHIVKSWSDLSNHKQLLSASDALYSSNASTELRILSLYYTYLAQFYQGMDVKPTIEKLLYHKYNDPQAFAPHAQHIIENTKYVAHLYGGRNPLL